jgi:imidazolonepropionase
LRYTVKGGVVYDAGQLLADVRALVKDSWEGDPDGPPHTR